MPKGQKILKPVEMEALYSDIGERLRLRAVLSHNSYDVLELELGISRTTIRRVEKPGYQITDLALIDFRVLSEAARRRKAYWLTREVYDDRYTSEKLVERFGICHRTLMRHIRLFKRQRILASQSGERIQHREAA